MSYKQEVEAAAAALKRGEEADFELAERTYNNTTPDGSVSLTQWCADVQAKSGRSFGTTPGKYYRRAWGLYLAAEQAIGRTAARKRTFKGEGGYYWEARDSSPSQERDEIRVREAVRVLRDPEASKDPRISQALEEKYQREDAERTQRRQRMHDEDSNLQRLDQWEAAIQVDELVGILIESLDKWHDQWLNAFTRAGQLSTGPGGRAILDAVIKEAHERLNRTADDLDRTSSWNETGETDIDAGFRKSIRR
jgi:hypothetical protein